TPEEAREGVGDYVRTKPAFIKIWRDAGGGKLKTMPPAVYQAIIDEAARQGTYVAAHTVTVADAKGLYRADLVGATHMPARARDHRNEELLPLIRERVKTSKVPLWFSEHGSPEALGPHAWDDPLLWEMLPRDQVMAQQGEALSKMTPEAVERARKSSKETG